VKGVLVAISVVAVGVAAYALRSRTPVSEPEGPPPVPPAVANRPSVATAPDRAPESPVVTPVDPDGIRTPASEAAIPEAPMPANPPPTAVHGTDPKPEPPTDPAKESPAAGPARAPNREEWPAGFRAEDPGERLRAVMALGGKGNPTDAAILRQLAREDIDVFVRRVSVKELWVMKSGESVPTILASFLNDDDYIAREAAKGLLELTGIDVGYKSKQTRAEREKGAQPVHSWITTHLGSAEER